MSKIIIQTAANVRPLDVDVDHLLDGMMAAQDALGQIAWIDISEYAAKGTDVNGVRVIVVNYDTADVQELNCWVHGTYGPLDGVLDVHCDTCAALPDENCVTPSGVPTRAHNDRHANARVIARHLKNR